jgi:mycoredoxin
MISMYSASWCGDCVRTKEQLDELGLEYEYLDIDAHSEHKARAIDISGRPNIPVVVFPDGTYLVEPTDVALHEKVQQLGLIQ